MPDFFKYVAALIPSTGVGFLFYLVVRAMLEGDRRERLALAKWDAAHPKPTSGGDQPTPGEAHDVADREDGVQTGPGADRAGRSSANREMQGLPPAAEPQRRDEPGPEA